MVGEIKFYREMQTIAWALYVYKMNERSASGTNK